MREDLRRHVLFGACIASAALTLAQGPAIAGSVNATTGSLQWQVPLAKQVFTSIALSDLSVPTGAPATVEITADAAVQGDVSQACQIISQIVVDGIRLGNQTIDQLTTSGTIDVRHTHVVLSVAPGTHPVALQIYPECDGLASENRLERRHLGRKV